MLVTFLTLVLAGPTIAAAKIWGDDAINPVVFTLFWICVSVVAFLFLYPSNGTMGARNVVIAGLMMGLPLFLLLILAGRVIAKRLVRGRVKTFREKVVHTDWPD